MASEYEIESMDHQIQKIFERFDLIGTRFSAGEFEFRISKEAPQASILLIQLNTKSLRNEHKTNSATIVGVVSKANTECVPPRSDYGYIQLTESHFKPEGDFCYFHYYGEGPNINKMISETKQVIRDLVREHKKGGKK